MNSNNNKYKETKKRIDLVNIDDQLKIERDGIISIYSKNNMKTNDMKRIKYNKYISKHGHHKS